MEDQPDRKRSGDSAAPFKLSGGYNAYYLVHGEERERIARAGQKRTLSEHIYPHRVQKMLDVLLAPDFRALAPMRTASSAERWAARREVYTHLHMLDALLDEAKSLGLDPLRRGRTVIPCLIRRLLL